MTDKKQIKKQEIKEEVTKSSNNTKTTRTKETTESNRAYTQRKRRLVKAFGRKKGKGRREKKDEFEARIVSIRRVAKVKKGGRRLKLSVMVVVGDKKGRVGTGLAKGVDVRSGEQKAIQQAKANMIKVDLKGKTIPHEVTHSYGAAKVFLKPAVPGTGLIAGKAVRDVVELAGIEDIVSKMIGTKNQITNVYCTIEALEKLKLDRI